ncbi:hypothetical protein NT6N_17190 [Oceaniferula spumae]|uniref:Uncharacterized protein n=1 Tax=Oceaniferula spumae TaxID=2979115 RepID=A0AAT9FL52_9BACT
MFSVQVASSLFWLILRLFLFEATIGTYEGRAAAKALLQRTGLPCHNTTTN